jgi:integrase
MPAYKDEERGTWYASFHYTDYTGINRRKMKRGFKTKREASEYERQFKERGHKDPTITYAAFVEEYLEDCRHRFKPTSMTGKENCQNNYIIPYFGKMKLCDITPLKVRTWQNEMMEDGAYADTTLNRMHTEFSSAMNYAMKYFNLQQNPCRLAGTMGSQNAAEMKIWTQEQFEQFIKHEKKAAYRLAFLTLYWTGMRAGELLALTPEDIERDKMVIHVTKGFAVVDGTEMFLTPKTPSSKRDIEINKQLHDELLKYIDGMIIGRGERLFYFQRPAMLKEFHKKIEKAGLEQIRLHDLRHSHASWLIHKGIPITAISKRLGHRNPATTLRVYSHLMPGDERSVAEKIEESMTASADTS